MKVSEAILRYLKNNDVDTIFGLPSATISPVVDSLNDLPSLEYIMTKNEAAASYSACKYARVSQKLGVVLVSGSVGLCNAMNGITEATTSNAPMLVITGNVATWQEGLGAIQEVEVEKILNGVVKYSKKINDNKDVIKEIKKAIEIAFEYPRGAVHIGLPFDLQRENYEGKNYEKANIKKYPVDYKGLEKAVSLINKSESGLLFIGEGCRGLEKQVKALAEKLSWRIMCTPSGKGVIKNSNLNMGFYGFSGTDLADRYINETNLETVIALGTRLGECSTQNFKKELIKNKLIHIDLDKSVFNRAYKADIAIVSYIKESLDYLISNVDLKSIDNSIKEKINEDYPCIYSDLSLRTFSEKITKIMPSNTFYVNDIGSSKIFNLKYMDMPEEADFEVNINYGCMGSSVGAIGISRLDKERPVAVFVGDGSFIMTNMAELVTLKKYNMKIVTFVINNSVLRFVDDGHKVIFGRTKSEFTDSYVDICKIADAVGIRSIKITNTDEIDTLKTFLNSIDGPAVVELMTNSKEPIPTNRFKDLS